jgi:outer membrane protein
MMKRTTVFVFLAFIGVNAFSQDQTGDRLLTFKEAIDIAMRNNVTLIAQRNLLTQQKVNKTYRWAQLGPQASVNATLYESNGNRFIQQEGKVVNATVNGLSANLNIQQPIFNGMSLFYNARGSSEIFDAQLETVNRSMQTTMNNVATQYLQVLLDKELAKIALENLKNQQTQFEQVKAQVELGARSPVDEYNQQAQVSTAELRLMQANYTLVNSRITLMQTLLLDPTDSLSIEEPEWNINGMALDNLSLPSLVETALQKRSDLKAFKHLENSARMNMHSSKGNYMPGLNAFYSNGSAWNQLKDADTQDPGYRNFDQQFRTDNKQNNFGLSLNIPLFTGFQNRAIMMQSKVQYQNSKLNRSSQEVLVKGDVLRAFENYQAIQIAYKSAQTGLEASQMAFDLERERYNLGVTSFVDFVNANRTYLQAQTDMASAKYRFLFQKVALDFAVGTLKVEDIPY